MNRHSDKHFFLRFEPDIPHVTHQSGTKGVGRPGNLVRTYKTPALRQFEEQLLALLKPLAPSEPWDCPIHLSSIWYFRAPKKLRLSGGDCVWKTTKPDTDNLVKTLKDCLKRAGFYEDDALVVLDTIGKMCAPEDSRHGIEVRIRDLSAEPETKGADK